MLFNILIWAVNEWDLVIDIAIPINRLLHGEVEWEMILPDQVNVWRSAGANILDNGNCGQEWLQLLNTKACPIRR